MKTTLTRIQKNNPIILNLTNSVSEEFIANGLLSIGASPIMSKAIEEMNPLIELASALVVNIGTLNNQFIRLIHAACAIANTKKVPIVFDPVGVGASQYRTETATHLIHEYQIQIIRGNASEIQALAGENVTTHGVDCKYDSLEAIGAAQHLCKQNNHIIVVSGEVDAIVSSDNTTQISGGSAWMPMITGCGCLHTAMIAAFCAEDLNYFNAAFDASYFYSQCGEQAALQSSGPGSFKTRFLDQLNQNSGTSHENK